MKKLLALGATVLLSAFLVLIELDIDEGTSMICNEPTMEQVLEEEDNNHSIEEAAKLMEQKDPITDWRLECSDYCYEWRIVKWMDYVTCVQTRVVEKQNI